MNKPSQTETAETIETVQLEEVTGGCAACGNPGGQCLFQKQNQQWPQAGQAQTSTR